MWDKTGWGTVFKHGNEYCCPKNEPPPLLDCRWVGQGDCADNTCGASEVTLLTDERGDSYGGCSCKSSLPPASAGSPSHQSLTLQNRVSEAISMLHAKHADAPNRDLRH